MIGVKKKAAIALNKYIDSIIATASDYKEPLPGEMRLKLDPHLLRYADSLVMKKKRSVPYLRPIVAASIVVLLCCLVFIQPVRAGVMGAITYFINAVGGEFSSMVYRPDFPGIELVTTDTFEKYTIAQYSLNERHLTIILEDMDYKRQTWVDIQGDPYIVDNLSFPPYEAMCHQDEDSLHAAIETESMRLLVTMDGTDRELFVKILRSIRPSSNDEL